MLPVPAMEGWPKALTAPVAVIRPMVSLPALVNHTAPSGPAVMPMGSEMLACPKLDTVPVVVIRPMVSLPWLVNHRRPSGPTARPAGSSMDSWANVVTAPAGVIRPMLFPARLVNHRFPSGPVTMASGRARSPPSCSMVSASAASAGGAPTGTATVRAASRATIAVIATARRWRWVRERWVGSTMATLLRRRGGAVPTQAAPDVLVRTTSVRRAASDP